METNVNDLVETVDDLRFCEFDHSDPDPLEYSEEYKNGFNEACSKVVEILYSLSTEPVEVPEYVAEWYEGHKDDLEQAIFDLHVGLYKKSINERTGFEEWAVFSKNKPIEILIKMKDGYTVVKEQLYYVMLPEEITDSYNVYGLKRRDYGSINVGLFDRRDIGKCKKSQLTEAEIKAIDERYWAFAVPVEE